MRAITLLTMMVVAISLLTGIAIGLYHQQAADNAGVAAYQQQFSDYAKAAGAYK